MSEKILTKLTVSEFQEITAINHQKMAIEETLNEVIDRLIKKGKDSPEDSEGIKIAGIALIESITTKKVACLFYEQKWWKEIQIQYDLPSDANMKFAINQKGEVTTLFK